MPKPKLLDLFAGAGGSSHGYTLAGFDVTGVDQIKYKRYPYRLIRSDVMRLKPSVFDEFDVIHASPPCQHYSLTAKLNKQCEYPDLIPRVLEMLEGRKYIIENVPQAPLRPDLMLCGSMFGLGADTPNGFLYLKRHRIFQISGFEVSQPVCKHNGRAISVTGGGPTTVERTDGLGGRVYQGLVVEKRQAMDIDWMTGGELNEALPPAYTKYIGDFAIQQL